MLDDLLESEELWWSQRSRTLWLKNGHKNTKKIHQKASHRKSRNWINSICDDHGETVSDENDIANVFTNYFIDMFTSSDPSRIEEAVEVVHGRISDDIKNILKQEFSKEEVYSALKSMTATAAPGPDGMLALFYQKFWSIVGDDVSSLVLDILNGNGDPSNINHTFICLIPKKKKPIITGDFRPISLCNVIFKIVTKTLANSLKLILPDIIDKFQSAFIPGRLITDNALIAFDVFHYMRKKASGGKGHVGIKLDMSKVYDRIEWPFLQAVLNSMGFSQKWVDVIMKCVSSVSFLVLLKGSPCQLFHP